MVFVGILVIAFLTFFCIILVGMIVSNWGSHTFRGTPINTNPIYLLCAIAVFLAGCIILFQQYTNASIFEFINNNFWLDQAESQLTRWLVLLVILLFTLPAIKLGLLSPSKLGKYVIFIFVFAFAVYEFQKQTKPVSDQCIDKNKGENQCLMYELPSGEVKIQLKGEHVNPTWKNLGEPGVNDMLAYDPNLAAPKANRIYISSVQECDNYYFFNGNGIPQVFYAITDKGYELFDKPTRHPGTGATTKPIDVIAKSDLCRVIANQEQAEKSRKAREKAEKIKAENARIRKELALQAAEEKRIRDQQQAETDKIAAENNAAERAQQEQQAAITQQIEQSRQGVPSEYCLGLFKNEGLTITVVNNRCGDFNNPDCASVSNMLKTNGMSVVDYTASTQVRTLPGCVAYQGTDSNGDHEQTLRCLVKILGPGYFTAPSCSGFVYDGSGYEVNRT
jgi:signal transduction histidine kinase